MTFDKATIIKDIDVYLNRCKSKHERACLILLFMLGLKSKELLSLKRSDFKTKGRIVWVYIKPVNSKIMFRLVPLPMRIKYVVELNEYLKTLLMDQRVAWKFKTKFNIRDFVYRISKKDLSPFDFRINRIKLFVNRNMPPYMLQEFFGYKHLGRLEAFINSLKEPEKNIKKYF